MTPVGDFKTMIISMFFSTMFRWTYRGCAGFILRIGQQNFVENVYVVICGLSRSWTSASNPVLVRYRNVKEGSCWVQLSGVLSQQHSTLEKSALFLCKYMAQSQIWVGKQIVTSWNKAYCEVFILLLETCLIVKVLLQWNSTSVYTSCTYSTYLLGLALGTFMCHFISACLVCHTS